MFCPRVQRSDSAVHLISAGRNCKQPFLTTAKFILYLEKKIFCGLPLFSVFDLNESINFRSSHVLLWQMDAAVRDLSYILKLFPRNCSIIAVDYKTAKFL